MNVIIVDDENLILQMETSIVKKVLENANVESFFNMKDALEYAKNTQIDIAFLDINLEVGSGLELAKKLQKLNEKVNIIFCTGYSEYSLDALELYCSAYLMKPLTKDKVIKALKKLRYDVSEKDKDLFIRCFGNFEAFYKGEPIKFKHKKTKEMLAFLIDRNGALLSFKEIMVGIFEEDGKDSYLRNLKSDLIMTFGLLGLENIFAQDWGKIGVIPDKINCDYYDYLNGDKDKFKGEYMSQYSFAETTFANL